RTHLLGLTESELLCENDKNICFAHNYVVELKITESAGKRRSRFAVSVRQCNANIADSSAVCRKNATADRYACGCRREGLSRPKSGLESVWRILLFRSDGVLPDCSLD